MKIDTNYIEKLAKILSDNNLTEITLEDENCAVSLRKEITGVVQTVATAPAVQAAPAPSPAAAPAAPAADNRKTITSPMVGTFYTSPSPDAKPFVQVGDTVKEGDVVCIVEAMKLMNEIDSEVSGKIVEICVENGQPVEYGQVLMYVEQGRKLPRPLQSRDQGKEICLEKF